MQQWLFRTFFWFARHKISKFNFTAAIFGLVWFFFFFINVDLAIFQPYLDLEAGDNQSLKIQVATRESNPGPLAPQAKSLTTRPPLLPLQCYWHYLWAVCVSE